MIKNRDISIRLHMFKPNRYNMRLTVLHCIWCIQCSDTINWIARIIIQKNRKMNRDDFRENDRTDLFTNCLTMMGDIHRIINRKRKKFCRKMESLIRSQTCQISTRINHSIVFADFHSIFWLPVYSSWLINRLSSHNLPFDWLCSISPNCWNL